jgi:nitrogen fixation protein NifU and related proteins
MTDSKSNFWQTHSIKFIECAFRTDRQETLRNADGHGQKTGDCGDSVDFFLVLQGDLIQNIAYALNGCIHTNACANAVIDLTQGQSLTSAWRISPEKVATYLESLPADHFHCAELAIGAFYLALADANRNRQSPWKKAYR